MPPDTKSAIHQEDKSSSDYEEIKESSMDLNRSLDTAQNDMRMKRKLDSISSEDRFGKNFKVLLSEDETDLQNPLNVDIFGHSLTSKKHLAKLTVNCPHCSRKVGALRFAFHLSRCMNTGSRRIGRQL